MSSWKFISLSILIFALYSCSSDIPVNYPNGKKTDHSTEKLMRINKYLDNKEKTAILDIIKEKKWNMKLSSYGFYYQILSEGEGDIAKEGDKIGLNYSLSLLNGIECYNSDSLGIKVFVIGKSQVEKGLDLGVRMLKKHSKARFIFPSYLAYGLIGDQNCIPARATIIYELEVVDLE